MPSYSQFCERYRQWAKRQKRSMRQIHWAGEKLFIDYCRPTVAVIDGASGEARQAQVFVAVLGASSYTFAEATWSQSLPDWIGSHQRAFAFFGGVPALLVPDNLRAAVKDPNRYDPGPNATYLELARHYPWSRPPGRRNKPVNCPRTPTCVARATTTDSIPFETFTGDLLMLQQPTLEKLRALRLKRADLLRRQAPDRIGIERMPTVA